MNKTRLIFIFLFCASCGPGFYINEGLNSGGIRSEGGGVCIYSSVTEDVEFSFELNQEVINNGSSVINSSSNAINGNFISDNGVVNKVVNGKFGNGLNFDEVDDRLLYAAFSPDTTDLSISLWFKHNGSLSGSEKQTLVQYNNPDNDVSFHIYIGEASGLIEYQLRASDGPGSGIDYTHSGFLDGNWHHLIITKSAANGIALFLDGMTRAADASIGNGALNVTTPIVFGYNLFDTANDGFNGQLDEINFWTRELSASEIQKLYECSPE